MPIAMIRVLLLVVWSALSLYIESPNNPNAHIQYKTTPLNNNFLFSLISITCPAYNANETAGITSANPISPIANG